MNCSSPNIAVEGFIARDPLCTLIFSHNSDYFSISYPQPVTDAIVKLSGNRGENEFLADNVNGTFSGSPIYSISGTTCYHRIDSICSGSDETVLRILFYVVPGGRLTKYLQQVDSFESGHRYYLCGSAEMVVEARDILIAMGVHYKMILSEIYF